MKSYIDRKPPGWEKKPDSPVIIVAGETETAIRANLYAFSDEWRKVRRRADRILNRNAFVERVDVCGASGEVIRTVRREKGGLIFDWRPGRGTPPPGLTPTKGEKTRSVHRDERQKPRSRRRNQRASPTSTTPKACQSPRSAPQPRMPAARWPPTK